MQTIVVWSKRALIVNLAMLVCAAAISAAASATSSGASSAALSVSSPPVSPAHALPTLEGVKVTDVYQWGRADDKTDARNTAALNEIIVVQVSKLENLMKRSTCDDKKVADCQPQDIVLFLDGRQIEGLIPESGAPKVDPGTLRFHLRRNSKNDEAWADLLGMPPLGKVFFERETEVSVGLSNNYALPTDVKKFMLTRIHELRFWTGVVLVVVLLFSLYELARRSDIIRDSGPQPPAPGRKPYSLSRFQMAFWFFWVIASFFFIWGITGAYDIITASTLGLIGIGAGTALGAAVIDAGKDQDSTAQRQALQAQEASLNAAIAQLDAQVSAVPPPVTLGALQADLLNKQAQLAAVQAQLPALAAPVPLHSRGLVHDLLTDASGISFHRFQMLVWTLVLGLVFIDSVWARLSMPEFSATLLALMGISSGTYIGFKIPEKQG